MTQVDRDIDRVDDDDVINEDDINDDDGENDEGDENDEDGVKDERVEGGGGVNLQLSLVVITTLSSIPPLSLLSLTTLTLSFIAAAIIFGLPRIETPLSVLGSLWSLFKTLLSLLTKCLSLKE